MDPFWLLGAFIFGVTASQANLPPLVGYLLAGFILNGLGIKGGETLVTISDAGVTLLLFTIGASNGWIDSEWLVVIAISLSLTFIMAAPINYRADDIYAFFSKNLKFFETQHRLAEDKAIETGNAQIASIGMGGVGRSAYDEMKRRHGDVVIGIDFDIEKVNDNCRQGRKVVYGDAGDSDFWNRIEPTKSKVNLSFFKSQALTDFCSLFVLHKSQNLGGGNFAHS